MIRSELCNRLGIEHPILLAGMGIGSGPELAAAVSNAGGLGVLGASTSTLEELEQRIRRTQEMTDRPFGVDTLYPGSTMQTVAATGGSESIEVVTRKARAQRDAFLRSEGLDPAVPPRELEQLFVTDFFDRQLELVLDLGVSVHVTGLGLPPRWFRDRAKKSGMTLIGIAGAARHAQRLFDQGMDAIIAQGADAGGHSSSVGTFSLIPQVVDALDGAVPVVAAGGIGDGRGVAAALALGADAVWIGTRFLAARESVLEPYLKRSIIAASGEDTIVSRSITGKPVRMLKSKWTALYEGGDIEALPMPYQFAVSQTVMGAAERDQRADIYAGVAGQAVGMVRGEETAADIVAELAGDAERCLRRGSELIDSSMRVGGA